MVTQAVFESLQDVAAAIVLIEGEGQWSRYYDVLIKKSEEIVAYADDAACHGAQVYGSGGFHRFFVRGRPGDYRLVMSRHHCGGWLSRDAVARAEELGVPISPA